MTDNLQRIIDNLRGIRREIQSITDELPKPGAPDDFGPIWRAEAERSVGTIQRLEAQEDETDD